MLRWEWSCRRFTKRIRSAATIAGSQYEIETHERSVSRPHFPSYNVIPSRLLRRIDQEACAVNRKKAQGRSEGKLLKLS